MYDLIIIGAGPAGITASVYAARKRMNLLVITKDIGGQAAISGDIENYTGYQFITGPELAAKFEEHMRKFAINLRENEEVTEVKKIDKAVYVKSEKGEYEAQAVIISSGKRSRELGVAGEKEFRNKGLTYCAICDAPLFSGKDVAVIGGGNSGLDAAIQLLKIANRIYLIEIAPRIMGDAIMREIVTGSDKITILTDARVTEVFGNKMVNGISIKKAEKDERIPVEGVFVEIGLIPNSEFTKGVEKNRYGEIKVTPRNETNVPGIFAAGDVTDVSEKQIVIACGEGSKAALAVSSYLLRQ